MSGRRTRPLGRLTRRTLPFSDPSIASLSAQERQVLSALWTARIGSEHLAVAAFGYLAATLEELGAPGPSSTWRAAASTMKCGTKRSRDA